MIPTLTVFYTKLLASLGTIIGAFLLSHYSSTIQNLEQRFGGKKLIWTALILFRLLPFCIVYFVLFQEPRGDVPFFWWKAKAVVKGGLVYRDFWSFHAPLFSYLITIPVLLWYNAKAIVLLMVLVESVIVFQTYNYYKGVIQDAFAKTLLYLILSAPMTMVILGGQEDIWFWGLALVLLFYVKNTKDEGFKLGILYALGLVVIKATFVFWLFPLLVFVKKKVPFLLGMIALGIPTLAILYGLVGMLFLMPIQHTSFPMSPNLFSVGMPFIGLFGTLSDYKVVNWVGLVMCIGFSFLLSYKVKDKPLRAMLPLSFIWTFASMNLFQLGAMGYYSFVYILPFVFETIDLKSKKDITLLMLFNLLIVIEPFVFTYLQNPLFVSFAVVTKTPLHLLQYGLQVLNVIGFMWVISKTYHKALAI